MNGDEESEVNPSSRQAVRGTGGGPEPIDDYGFEPGAVIDGIAELGLGTRYVGRTLRYLGSTTSTNAVLSVLAAEDEPSGTVVLADGQTEGRGRAGRFWFSPPGRGIWASVLLRADVEAERLAPLSVAASVSIAEALAGLTGLDVRVKWPNDILIDGRKLGGVLVETAQSAGERVSAAAVGIGLNVNLGPEELPEELVGRATSLGAALGRPIARRRVLKIVLVALECCFDRFFAGGIEAFREKWRERSSLLGRRVAVEASGRRTEGTVNGLAPSGALLVETDGGVTEEIWHGDVRLTRAEPG